MPASCVEVDFYQWCTLDDTWAEATHRDVSRLAQGATFASQAWQSASLRSRQNLKLWDALATRGRARFESCFYEWKAIGQFLPQRAVKLIGVKASPKTVTQFVYRTGTRALKDWNTQLQDVLKSSIRADVLPPGTFASRLKVDYLERVLALGTVFSVPNVPSADAILALEGTFMGASEGSLHDAAEGMHFMQVVKGKLRRRKGAAHRSGTCPASHVVRCVSAGLRGSGTRG
jgi:hypothetical protein